MIRNKTNDATEWNVLEYELQPKAILQLLYYYMKNFCNLIGLEQWYFTLIWNTYMWKLQTFAGSSINK